MTLRALGAGGPPVVRTAPVSDARRIGAYHVLTFREPDVARATLPGQFVNVAAGQGRLLRRPFSVYRSDRGTGDIAIAFDAIGSGTRWLRSRRPGDFVDVVGPLGRGFDVPAEPGLDVIVGGGYGAAALAFLAAELAARGGEVRAIVGAQTASRLFRDDLLDRSCTSIVVCTDDGSEGERALVTERLARELAAHPPRAVHGCGPMPMLRAVAGVCAQAGIPSRLAVEEFMACGIGVCWTCVLPVRADGALKHLRSCTDGPVFAGEEVAWAST